MGSIDLSVGAMVLLSGAASVQLLNSTGVGAAVLAAVAIIGGVLGLINGVIYAYGRIPSFVVTLGTLSVFSGLALKLLDGRAIPFDLPGFEYIAIGQAIPHLPNIALCALLAWAAAVFIAVRTRFGRYMYLIGGGELVARTAGIPVRRYKISTPSRSRARSRASARCCPSRALARPALRSDRISSLTASRRSSLAALRSPAVSGGPDRTLIGVLIIAMLDNGLNLMDASEYTQMIVKGLVVLAAVLVSRDRAREGVVK